MEPQCCGGSRGTCRVPRVCVCWGALICGSSQCARQRPIRLCYAKLGTAFVVDVHNPTAPAVVRLGVSDSVTSCAVDKQRGRIYIGSLDFSIFVLEKTGAGWVRSLSEETQLRGGLRRTVEDSFTTPFVMARLQLRGLHMSPCGRRLMFVADDQTNWSIGSDGQGVTRIHLHQFDDWTDAAAELALKEAVGQDDVWAVVWDLFSGLSEARVMGLVQALLDVSGSHGQQLYMLNMIGAKCKAG
ncbi:hypothetical protein DL89DRAFT_30080 [Linderina pennispora]|uniref:Uncharacterized protein n=1 Tax=Linderina pennispora TaxID=61395 RepID=A0A1Y1W4Z5_9FUNG|nr:uncharacterized protein DL89DRAFT_30080 [Linderina pennispora]ORX68274.1 hypothetical protein DL89DRAFT_30080 [Linderina pennispora]